jgi:hypothetical protein
MDGESRGASVSLDLGNVGVWGVGASAREVCEVREVCEWRVEVHLPGDN